MAGGDGHGRHAAHRGLGAAQPSGRPARQPRAGRSSQVNHRLTVAAAAATALASVALYPLISRTCWFFAGLGAVIVVAAVGTLTRLRPLPAIVCFLAALAGLFLYLNVLFCVPLMTIAKPGWFGEVVVFSLGIAGYLALLSSEGRERVRLWGRVVHTWPGQREPRGPDTRQLTAAGRRVGFATVVLALCVPLIPPGLRHSQRLFPRPGGGGGNRHARSPFAPRPPVEMNQQPC